MSASLIPSDVLRGFLTLPTSIKEPDILDSQRAVIHSDDVVTVLFAM